MARGGQHTCIDSSAKIVHNRERKFPKKEPTWSYQKRIGVSAGHPKIQQVSFTNCYMEDLQDPEPEMSCPLKRLHFPLLLQSRVNGGREREWRNLSHSLRVNEGGDREWRNLSQSHLWIPDGLLLKSSSGIEESETSLVSQPNTPHPLRPGLADFVCCLCCYSHFLWDHFKALFPDGPTSFCNQLAGGEACQNLR